MKLLSAFKGLLTVLYIYDVADPILFHLGQIIHLIMSQNLSLIFLGKKYIQMILKICRIFR